MSEISSSDRDDAIKQMVTRIDQTLRETAKAHASVEEYTTRFTKTLFSALDDFVTELIESGVEGIAPVKRYKLPTGKEALQLQIMDYKVIFVPLVGAAWPNPRDEARVPGAMFKEECGRIAVFLTDNPDRESFYDFLIWDDGSWFAWGYGWPKQAAKYEETNFRSLAVELIDSFVKDIHRTWKIRDETVLGDATSTSTAKRTYIYGLPGDE